MNAAPGKVDYFVAGQGLAGSLVARALLRRGRKVVVIDASDPSASSRVAAGLINPVTGQKFVRTWRADTLLPFARDYYRTWEAELGIRVYSEKTIWRFFDSEKEAEIWQQKRDDPKLAVYAAALPEGASERSGLRPQLGGIRVRDAAHVDTKNLLEAFREQLRRLGLLVEERVSAEEFRVGGGQVSWRDRTARKIVFCEGHAASSNPYFSWIPFRPAKGQVLTVRDPDFAVPDDLVMNRSKYLIPLGGGLFRGAATYEWDFPDERPSEAGRKEILDGLRKLMPRHPEVVAHEAGVRPIVKDMRPVAGVHPAHPEIAILNGLGSKGVLWGPYFAEQLVGHLEDGGELDPTVDARRNL